MTKRPPVILPGEASQPPENIIVQRRAAAPSRLDATLRTPRAVSENDVLFRVELALSRLENGDYGYCVRCEQPIAIEQLETDPSAVICSDCRPPHI